MSRVRKAGPLAPFADGFAAVLRAQGYTSHGAVKHRHLFASLSRWLEREKLAPVDLNEESSAGSRGAASCWAVKPIERQGC